MQRLVPFLSPTPLRAYVPLDDLVGHGIGCWSSTKTTTPRTRQGAQTGGGSHGPSTKPQRRRGVIGATKGNHGQAIAWAGQKLGIKVTVCVPHGNNPDKNEAMRGFGARLVEEGEDYDSAVTVADRLVREQGLTLIHSTNNHGVLSGAATLSLEILEDAPDVDAIVVGVGGGSQAVGAMTVARASSPRCRWFGVHAAAAPGLHTRGARGNGRGSASRHHPRRSRHPDAQPMTFEALREGPPTSSGHRSGDPPREFGNCCARRHTFPNGGRRFRSPVSLDIREHSPARPSRSCSPAATSMQHPEAGCEPGCSPPAAFLRRLP